MNIKETSKKYRNSLGFGSKNKCFSFLKAKDITIINWLLVDQYNLRLIDIGERIQSLLIVPSDLNVKKFITESFDIIKTNNIIEECFTNNGRANESVYYSWMLGYMVERLFVPFIQEELNLNQVVRSGKDNLEDPTNFNRKSTSDLIDPTKNITIDVQCGNGDSDTHIKRSKVDYVLANGYNGYVFTIGLGTGLYAAINLNSLEHEVFLPNPLWENVKCWTAPKHIFKSWSK